MQKPKRFNVVAVLRYAKWLLETEGLVQRRESKLEGGKMLRCSSFAIESASPGVPATDRDCIRKATLPWRALEQVTRIPIEAWNDQAGRTKSEVIAAFDTAIALARQPNH